MKIQQVIITSVLILSFSLLSACGTVHGFGKDVSKIGRDIQKASN